jgi:hypothetical protein
MSETPVVFMIFKRPDTTQRVFEAIARAKTRQLFVIADGPRNPGEAAMCAATRDIIRGVDWECDVRTNYAETNLGLKRRIASGLDWVFEQVEQAIILEDDCLPDPSFFPFCTELLDRYRDDERVVHISGDYFLGRKLKVETSYYFSRYPSIWGWATWRRAWEKFDVEMTLWNDPAIQARVLDQFSDQKERLFWQTVWQQVSDGTLVTWDYPWMLACMAAGGLAALPTTNLITNVGFRPDATHTQVEGVLGSVPRRAIRFPLTHPLAVERHIAADELLGRMITARPPLRRRITHRLQRILAHRGTS